MLILSHSAITAKSFLLQRKIADEKEKLFSDQLDSSLSATGIIFISGSLPQIYIKILRETKEQKYTANHYPF